MAQQIQDYYKETVQALDFIPDEETADKGIKAVLGILASKLDEQEAREFTAELPDYLDYETLRGHQKKPTPVSPYEAVEGIANELNLELGQANELMNKVISVAKEQAKGEVSDIAAQLSEDWRKALDEA